MSIKIEHIEKYKNGKKDDEYYYISGFDEISATLTPTEFQELREKLADYKETNQ